MAQVQHCTDLQWLCVGKTRTKYQRRSLEPPLLLLLLTFYCYCCYYCWYGVTAGVVDAYLLLLLLIQFLREKRKMQFMFCKIRKCLTNITCFWIMFYAQLMFLETVCCLIFFTLLFCFLTKAFLTMALPSTASKHSIFHLSFHKNKFERLVVALMKMCY